MWRERSGRDRAGWFRLIGLRARRPRVEEVRGRLEQIEAKAEPTAQMAEIAVRLPSFARSVDAHAQADRELLAGRIDLAGLDLIVSGWTDDGVVIADWDQKLRRRAEELDGLVVELKAMGDLWQRTLESLRGAEAPAELLDRVRTTPPTSLGGLAVEKVEDLSEGSADLPPTDGLRYTLAEGARVIVRPSGTEPKVKCYLEVVIPVEGDVDAARISAVGRLDAITADLRGAVFGG